MSDKSPFAKEADEARAYLAWLVDQVPPATPVDHQRGEMVLRMILDTWAQYAGIVGIAEGCDGCLPKIRKWERELYEFAHPTSSD